MQVSFKIILLVLFCGLLGAFGQIMFKLASDNLVFTFKGLLTNYKLILGLGFYGISAILFVLALRFGEVSTLYPLIATSYIWVLLIAGIFLKEDVGILKVLGIFSIILGVILISK